MEVLGGLVSRPAWRAHRTASKVTASGAPVGHLWDRTFREPYSGREAAGQIRKQVQKETVSYPGRTGSGQAIPGIGAVRKGGVRVNHYIGTTGRIWPLGCGKGVFTCSGG